MKVTNHNKVMVKYNFEREKNLLDTIE